MATRAGNVFLTGATGVVGSAVLEQLLERTSFDVTVLLRAESQDEFESKSERLIQSLSPPTQHLHNRVRWVVGDITLEQLGLSEESWEFVTAQCTHIVHSAGKVKLNQSISEARSNSLFTAKQIVQLASCIRNLQKVEVLSTIGVAGCLPGSVPEERLTMERRFHNTYEQAKAEAEEIYWDAIE